MSPEDTSSSDPWQVLESAWQDAVEPGLDSREVEALGQRIVCRGRRQQRIAHAVLGGELLVALAFGGLALFWLWQGPSSERAAGIFVLTLLATVGALRRQAWLRRQPDLDAPPDRYLEILRQQNQEGFRALQLGRQVLMVQVLFFSLWLPFRLEPFELASILRFYGFLALWSAGFLLVFHQAHRYLAREDRRLLTLLQELRGDPEAGLGSI